MRYRIYFVTTNRNKFEEIRRISEGIEIEWINHDYPEIQEENLERIAESGAKYCADLFEKSVFVEDSGLFIDALNGFPGPFSAYVYDKIGNKGILKLMDGIDERGAVFRSVVSFCEPGKNPISFVGEVRGVISGEIRGKHGFGYDPIFSYRGRTFAEMSIHEKNEVSHRRKAFEKFLRWLR
ncbi:MAG: XTP/dITP diphosphatase [Candidatus Syntropharchaeia archaeon]